MINLLPPKEKEELISERNKKLAIVLGNIIVISLACLALILFSLKFYILREINYQKNIYDNNEEKYQNPDFLLFKGLVEKYNTTLVQINDFYKKEIYFNDILKNVIEIQRPAGLYLTSIDIHRVKEDNLPTSATSETLRAGKIKVSLSGVSNTRDNLLIFKSNIEKDEKIENVYFPSHNWIKPKDIIFNLNFNAKAP